MTDVHPLLVLPQVLSGVPMQHAAALCSRQLLCFVAASIKIVFEPQPKPKAIASLAGTNIVAIAAGHNHALAVDDTGFAYAWGNGGAPLLERLPWL
jgi:alpha-tubulin suppressor-like RCC1 family protein